MTADQKFNVFFETDSELAEWEAENRGWRNDVYVAINDDIFRLNIYTPTRLLQDYETEIKDYGYYPIDCNIVLVPYAKKETIIATIHKLVEQGYFREIKPYSGRNIEQLSRVY
ncbi:MAG: hypothetical protein IKP88_06105 [Lachnospiraceae bacterium]|nr:hypothetical protein [Lachnospiraceae bacterium]MBR6982206.1 hypothetical protein [Ruminococcus sp.]